MKEQRSPKPDEDCKHPVGSDPLAPAGGQLTCAYCHGPAEGNFSIHRDGFGVGPQVELCDRCAAYPVPTCEEIWEAIAEASSFDPADGGAR